MVTEELGGNIVLDKFRLDPEEMVVAKKMIGKYAEKIQHITDYNELKLEMKSHLKGQNKHFEMKCHVLFDGGKAISEAEGINPFVMIDEVLQKIIQELQHKIKK